MTPFAAAFLTQLYGLIDPQPTPPLLVRFMKDNEITVTRLADLSGYSVRQIFYLRHGRPPNLRCAKAIVHACSVATGRHITIDEVFDVRGQSRKAVAV